MKNDKLAGDLFVDLLGEFLASKPASTTCIQQSEEERNVIYRSCFDICIHFSARGGRSHDRADVPTKVAIITIKIVFNHRHTDI